MRISTEIPHTCHANAYDMCGRLQDAGAEAWVGRKHAMFVVFAEYAQEDAERLGKEIQIWNTQSSG